MLSCCVRTANDFHPTNYTHFEVTHLHYTMFNLISQPAEPGGPGVTTGLLQHTGAGPVQDLQARGGRRSRQGGFTLDGYVFT